MAKPLNEALICLFSGLVSFAFAAKSDWAEGTRRADDGATRRYYNRAARLPWKNFMGDWHDANDVPQGSTAYAVRRIVDEDSGKFVEWDVTELVRKIIAGEYPNQGFFLRVTKGSGTIVFCSREYGDPAKRPRLFVQGLRGALKLSAQADTFIAASTYRSQGASDVLRVSKDTSNVLIRFDLTKAKRLGRITKAVLRLYTTKQYGTVEVGVFRCNQGERLKPTKPRPGIASRYLRDRGIEKEPHVIFATGFESRNWLREWTYGRKTDAVDTVFEDAARKFKPLSGKALRVKIAEGANAALNLAFKFRRETGSEPEEIFFRYYLRFGDDWNPTVQGGKLPGISGTYGVAGWGGRKVDGTNGWSARGSFGLAIPKDNPLGGLYPIGTYCYHADMKGWYGDIWPWTVGYRGFLEKNRWYCIEQYLKLNTPRRNDGVLRAWVDGRLAFEKTDIRFRDVGRLKIEQIWMNVYHGGKKPSPYDQHLFIDNVVIAKSYIGPMQQTAGR